MRKTSLSTLVGTTMAAGLAFGLGGAALAASPTGSGTAPAQAGSSLHVLSGAGATGGDVSSHQRAREIRRAGRCSGRSDWEFEVEKEDRNRLEVEFEVDQNRSGDRWGVILKRNGRAVLRRAYRTRAPEGSFEAKRYIRNARGTDRLVAIARNIRTGERCRARINFSG